MPLCFPPSGRAAVDMQPSPRGFSSPQGPSPKLLCAGHAPKPLTRMSAHCWSLDENLSCSPQHNVAIIAPLQENDTCLLVHSGPRKADRDLSGSCWEKESFTDGWKLLLLSDLQFLLQGRGCYLHPGFRASSRSSAGAPALVVSGGKGPFVFMSTCCTKPAPSLWVLPPESSTLGSISESHRLKLRQGQAGEVCVS